jgi:ribosomal protein S21
MQRTGLLRELKKRRHFISKSEARRLAQAKAMRRARKKAAPARPGAGPNRRRP